MVWVGPFFSDGMLLHFYYQHKRNLYAGMQVAYWAQIQMVKGIEKEGISASADESSDVCRC